MIYARFNGSAPTRAIGLHPSYPKSKGWNPTPPNKFLLNAAPYYARKGLTEARKLHIPYFVILAGRGARCHLPPGFCV